MTSVGYIATFHMAAPTQAAVFMKILLIPARSLLGAGGCVLPGLYSVRLTQVLGKASALLSSPSAGTPVYKLWLQNFWRLEPGLLTGGDSRSGFRTPVWPVLSFFVALAKPFY